uniref:EpsG family protein n=1 Tax=Providencia stuartii TaxID=588 RepID=A0AAI9GFS9_PROST|nr:EpsG family protein [Providencia stuartii]
MITFLVPLLYIIFITLSLKNKNVFIIFLFLIPIIFFSTYRGTLGPDTENYIKIFNSFEISDMELSIFSEPLFYSLIFISKKISGNVETFFFLSATLAVFLYALLINKYECAKIFLLSIGPVFLVDTLTNGMRIGIAYQILALGLILNTNNKRLTIIASLFHISSIFYYLYTNLVNPIISKINRKSIILFSSFFCLLPFIIYVIIKDPRIFEKINYYSNFNSPSIISGISDIYIIVVIALLSINRNCSTTTYVSKIILLILVLVSFKIAAIFSYAILRLLKLVLLSTIVYFKNNDSSLLKNEKFLIIFLLIPYTTNFILYIYRNPELYL